MKNSCILKLVFEKESPVFMLANVFGDKIGISRSGFAGER